MLPLIGMTIQTTAFCSMSLLHQRSLLTETPCQDYTFMVFLKKKCNPEVSSPSYSVYITRKYTASYNSIDSMLSCRETPFYTTFKQQ